MSMELKIEQFVQRLGELAYEAKIEGIDCSDSFDRILDDFYSKRFGELPPVTGNRQGTKPTLVTSGNVSQKNVCQDVKPSLQNHLSLVGSNDSL